MPFLDVISFSAAISTCRVGGQWRVAMPLLDVISFISAISAGVGSGQWHTTMPLLDVISYSPAISEYGIGAHRRGVVQLLD
eukprot:12429015-Karenia_brevis.AAC.1